MKIKKYDRLKGKTFEEVVFEGGMNATYDEMEVILDEIKNIPTIMINRVKYDEKYHTLLEKIEVYDTDRRVRYKYVVVEY